MKYILFIITLSITASGKPESLSLPDPLLTSSGEKITTAEQWQEIGRPETLELFRTNIYGRNPIGKPDDLRFELKEVNKQALAGTATLKRVDIHFSGPGGKGVIQLSLFIPNKAKTAAPGFLLICNRDRENIDHTRKKKTPFWPVERIVERGYIAAAFHKSDLDPDTFDHFKNGVHGIYDAKDSERKPDAWGTISAWAWGASRVMDYLEEDKDIDADRFAVVGHSRGGKTALWCGAQDERFAMVVSNNSGCTGAALARNKKGERVKRINKVFPHWFCENYKKFNDKEDELPVDQHQLIALIAPRLVYVASATKDLWADPEGEFLSCVHAEPVYQLFGLKGLTTKTMPKPEHPLHAGHIGHHLRIGKHDLNLYDWNCYMDFADKHWKKGK